MVSRTTWLVCKRVEKHFKGQFVYAHLLQNLLLDGTVRLEERPPMEPKNRAEVEGLLRKAYAAYRLDIPGPLVEFAADAALDAVRAVMQACWFLLSQQETEEEMVRALQMSDAKTAADHLSADLVLRYLPNVYRRARTRDPYDPLTRKLEDILRRWPLSGVLADVAEGPLATLDFGGRRGLQLLYAERLARHEKAAWFPPAECIELVWQSQGRRPPMPGAMAVTGGQDDVSVS